jgi:hypothetical protein
MLRQKAKSFRPLTLSLEELVPPNHFYRKLETHLHLRFALDEPVRDHSSLSKDPLVGDANRALWTCGVRAIL